MDSPGDLNLTLDEIATLYNNRIGGAPRQKMFREAMDAWKKAHASQSTVDDWERLADLNEILVRALNDDQVWLSEALQQAEAVRDLRPDLDQARAHNERLLSTARRTESEARHYASRLQRGDEMPEE